MAALLDVVTVGYVGERVAGTVVLIRDEASVIVVDPGMVAQRSDILGPLRALGVGPDDVTDVVLSHHHPDHTVNIALFGNAVVHDFMATYDRDLWIDHDFDGGDRSLTSSVRLLRTPGHTPEDLSTLVETGDGLIACTHLWWTADGPADDPFAPDREQLRESRELLLGLRPALIVPGHGEPFTATDATPI